MTRSAPNWHPRLQWIVDFDFVDAKWREIRLGQEGDGACRGVSCLPRQSEPSTTGQITACSIPA
jgi:hypothetical protein